jgi:hypothetical protein
VPLPPPRLFLLLRLQMTDDHVSTFCSMSIVPALVLHSRYASLARNA